MRRPAGGLDQECHATLLFCAVSISARRLPMSRLKALFEELGFDDVETFIASGNVLFSTQFRVIGREFYWLCRVRTSDSKVWTLPELKGLRLPTSTMRNMTSLRKLIAKHLD
jgi:uncharacterized protein (DUF1697 family)